MKHYLSFWPNIVIGVLFGIMACFEKSMSDMIIDLFVCVFNFILIICMQQGEKIENQEKIIENQEKILLKLDNLNFTAEFKK